MRLRLLFLNHNYRHFGTYFRVMPMAEQLAARGHHVTVLTVSREHQWKPTWSTVNGVQLGEMPNLNQGNSGEGYGPIDNLLRVTHSLAHRYDIIHMFDHKPNATSAGFSGRLRGAKLVADWADWWGGPGGVNDVPKRRIPAIGKFEAWWEIKSKRWADRVVTISTVLRQRAIECGVPAEHTLYLPTGAALDRISPIPMAAARQQLGVPAERLMAGFIGFGQGELELIMRAQQQITDLWFMVIGPPNPGVLQLAQEHGVADRLWQTGMVLGTQVATYLACADVMCMPMHDSAANRGRLPNKVLDYLAAGRPIIANPVGDVKTIIEQYQAGLLVDTTGFAEAILQLRQDAQLRERLGQNARRAAETAYAWPKLIDQLEAFYADLLSLQEK
jgi:glycosyltransferase involved in cell wall biosynthesis